MKINILGYLALFLTLFSSGLSHAETLIWSPAVTIDAVETTAHTTPDTAPFYVYPSAAHGVCSGSMAACYPSMGVDPERCKNLYTTALLALNTRSQVEIYYDVDTSSCIINTMKILAN